MLLTNVQKSPFRRTLLSLSNGHNLIRNPVRYHGDYPKEETIQIRWLQKDGSEKITPAAIGGNILQVAHKHGIELEGACEGVCACSTCHIILSREVCESLPEPEEKEDDMLDQAPGLTPTSRLGCQVTLQQEHDKMIVKLPKITRNFYVVSCFLSTFFPSDLSHQLIFFPFSE
jgi:ferredoxin